MTTSNTFARKLSLRHLTSVKSWLGVSSHSTPRVPHGVSWYMVSSIPHITHPPVTLTLWPHTIILIIMFILAKQYITFESNTSVDEKYFWSKRIVCLCIHTNRCDGIWGVFQDQISRYSDIYLFVLFLTNYYGIVVYYHMIAQTHHWCVVIATPGYQTWDPRPRVHFSNPFSHPLHCDFLRVEISQSGTKSYKNGKSSTFTKILTHFNPLTTVCRR